MIILHRLNHCSYYVLGEEVPQELEGLFSNWDYLTELVESLGYKYSRQLSELLGLVVYKRD